MWEPLLNPFIPLLPSFNHFITLPQSFRMESKSSSKIYKILYDLASTHLSRPISYDVPILTSASARLTSLPASALPLFAALPLFPLTPAFLMTWDALCPYSFFWAQLRLQFCLKSALKTRPLLWFPSFITVVYLCLLHWTISSLGLCCSFLVPHSMSSKALLHQWMKKQMYSNIRLV